MTRNEEYVHTYVHTYVGINDYTHAFMYGFVTLLYTNILAQSCNRCKKM